MFHLLLAVVMLTFVSTGLPDSLLGSAWPELSTALDFPVSGASLLSLIIALCTAFSALQTARLTRRFGTGKIAVFSAALAAVGMFGFSVSRSYWQFCLWSVPYGLAGGCIDASASNYVATWYPSRYMNWMHCLWSVGCAVGPYLMGFAIRALGGWDHGFLAMAFVSLAIALLLAAGLPLWNRDGRSDRGAASVQPAGKTLSLREAIRLPGMPSLLLCSVFYCSTEQISLLWISTYLASWRGLTTETAAQFASVLFAGITIGRLVSGFLANRYDDRVLIRSGIAVSAVGMVLLPIPGGIPLICVSIFLLGMGLGPVNPCLLHSAPAHFGRSRSAAAIGFSMAFSYLGSCTFPPLFGLITQLTSVSVLPFYLMLTAGVFFLCHRRFDAAPPLPEETPVP